MGEVEKLVREKILSKDEEAMVGRTDTEKRGLAVPSNPQAKFLIPPTPKLALPPDVEREREEAKRELDELEAEVAAAGGLQARALKIGICKGSRTSRKGVVYKCGKRAQVWMPAQLCEKCLLAALKEMEDDESEEDA